MNRPENGFFKLSGIQIFLVVVWIVGLGFAIPHGIWSDIVPIGPSSSTCILYVPASKQYNLFNLAVGRATIFISSLVVTWTSYIGIYIKMVKSKNKV